MSVSSHLDVETRRSLETLATKFRELASKYPNLRSEIVICPDQESLDMVNCIASDASVSRCCVHSNRPEHVVQFLVDDDEPGRARRAFEDSWRLARLAVEYLIDLGSLTPTDSPPDAHTPFYFEGLKHHHITELVSFVHQTARTPGPDFLRLYEPHVNEPDGASYQELSIPIFEASALAIERVLRGFQSDPPAGTTNPSTDASTTPGTTAEPPPEDKSGAKGTTEQLTRNDWKLLRATRDMGAIDLECAASRDRITARARTGHAESKHNQESFERLKRMRLIDAARRVGTWLTPKGLSLLDVENR